MTTMSLPAQIARTRRFTLGVPGQFTVAPDGGEVLFLRTRAGDNPAGCLWALDLDSGTERLLVDPAELLAAEPAEPAGPTEPGTGISAYAVDQAARLAAFALTGGLWTVDVADGVTRRLPARSPVVDPRPDPAGRRIAYVCDGALRVIEADGTGDRVIAAADQTDVTFGVGEHTGYAGLGGLRGFWWAPDGARLLVARVDSAAVQRWHVADPAEPGRAPRVVRYPAAGTANADVTLWIAALDGSRTQARWDRDAFEYVPGAGWDAHGPYAVVQSRDQRTVRFLGIDPASGETTVLREQRDACWVLLVPGSPARTASGAVVCHADLDDTRYLTMDGTPVTPAGLQLQAVLGVDGDEVLFTASAEPTETHLWTYRAGDGIRKLTAEPAVHDGTRRAGTLVHVARGADRPGGRTWSRGTASRPFPSPRWPNGRCSTCTRPGSCLGRGSCRRCCTCRPGTGPARAGFRSWPTPTAGRAGNGSPPNWTGGAWCPSGSPNRASPSWSRTGAVRPDAAPAGNERSTATCSGRSCRIR